MDRIATLNNLNNVINSLESKGKYTLASQVQEVFEKVAQADMSRKDFLSKGVNWAAGLGMAGGAGALVKDTMDKTRDKQNILTQLAEYGYTLDMGIRINVAGPGVRNWQRFLNDHFDGRLDDDGRFGQSTLIVTKNFQKAHGIDPDGAVGTETMKAALSLLEENMEGSEDLSEMK